MRIFEVLVFVVCKLHRHCDNSQISKVYKNQGIKVIEVLVTLTILIFKKKSCFIRNKGFHSYHDFEKHGCSSN